MKKLCIVFFFLLFCIAAFSKICGGIDWVNQFGTTSGDRVSDICIDDSGNIYVVGSTGGDLAGSLGNSDMFIGKFDSLGNNLWYVQHGSTGIDGGYGIDIDSEGNIYACGKFAEVDPDEYFDNYVLIKISPDGTELWTVEDGTIMSDIAIAVKIDSKDNIYITGEMNDDMFLIKYSTDSTKQWERTLGSGSNDRGLDIALDNNENIYVSGRTYGNFDGGSNSGAYDYFIVKYSTEGTKAWSIQNGTGAQDYGESLVIDNSDNIYLTGITQRDLDGEINNGQVDIFLSKYNTSGTRQWTRLYGTDKFDNMPVLEFNGTDALYISCLTAGNMYGHYHWGSYDFLLMKLNLNGDVQWSVQFGSNQPEYTGGIQYFDSNIYIGGYTEGGTFAGSTLVGDADGLIIKCIEQHEPELNFTGEAGYVVDAIEPDSGTSQVIFEYKVQYSDADFDEPISGFPRVHILENSSGITGSPFTMSWESGDTSTSMIYSYSTSLSVSDSYSYYFEVIDSAYSNTETMIFNGPEILCIASGKVKTSTDDPIEGIEIQLLRNDSSYNTATTDASGDFSFTDLPLYSTYRFIPGAEHYNILPSSKTYSNISDDITDILFTGYLDKWWIRGRVSENYISIENAEVTLFIDSVENTTVLTDSSGRFEFFNLNAGSTYLIVPSKTNYTFDPVSREYINLSSQHENQDFEADYDTWEIAGTITENGKPVSGIRINLSGESNDYQYTNTQGEFSFSGLPAGSTFTVSPQDVNFKFQPKSQTFTDLTKNETADFTATRIWFSSLDNLKVYPNPWNINSGVNGITFANLTKSCTIYIYNIAGELIIEIRPDSLNYTWEMNNLGGTSISSGIYLYIIKNNRSESKKGKIVVIK